MSFLPPASPRARTARQTAIRRARLSLPADLSDNVLRTLDRALESDWAEGLGWYLAAHSIASDIGRTHALSLSQSAGVVAALSPQLGWADNIAAAWIGAESDGSDFGPAGLTLGQNRARRILQGEDPASTLGGRKVRSFYRNVLEPGRPGPVTVDRHALSVALGLPPEVTGPDKRLGRCLERPGPYLLIGAAYRAAGRALDILPHEAQAVAWIVRRRELDEYASDPENDLGNLRTAHIRARRAV